MFKGSYNLLSSIFYKCRHIPEENERRAYEDEDESRLRLHQGHSHFAKELGSFEIRPVCSSNNSPVSSNQHPKDPYLVTLHEV